jgi:hypothetical protein
MPVAELLHVPPATVLLSTVVLPVGTVAVPLIEPAEGIAFTVTTLVAIAVPIVYFIVAVPAVTPVTIPVVFTVAIPVARLLHVPPGVVLASAVVPPAHTVAVPVIVPAVVAADALTVIALVAYAVPHDCVTL